LIGGSWDVLRPGPSFSLVHLGPLWWMHASPRTSSSTCSTAAALVYHKYLSRYIGYYYWLTVTVELLIN